MSMRYYINRQSEARLSRRIAGSVGTGFEHYERRPRLIPLQSPAARRRSEQANPGWLTTGLQQYLELVDEEGKIAPREAGEDFSHLTASAQPGKTPSFFEVTSDAFYIPQGADIGRTALGGNVFLLQASFSFGAKSGKTPGVKPRLTLDVVEIGGEGRENVIRAYEENEGVQLLLEDLTDESGGTNTLARVKSGIVTPKTDPQVSKPVVREQKDGKWNTPMYPGNAADGLLKVSLSPVLNEQVQRIPIESSVPTLAA